MRYNCVMHGSRSSLPLLLLLAAASAWGDGATNRRGTRRSGERPASADRAGARFGEEEGGERISMQVKGVDRTALLFAPAQAPAEPGAPVVLVFHGHGGTAEDAARSFRLHRLWPEAAVCYMQGLTGTPGRYDSAGARSGWQKAPGQMGNRDVLFVDEMLTRIRERLKVDPGRVFALGHSNGSAFTYVLWNQRPDAFAAFCSAAAQNGKLIRESRPKSTFVIAGKQDRISPFETQMRTIELLRELIEVDGSRATTAGLARSEPGIDGTTLVTYIHEGGHEFPEEALPLVVQFFQRHRGATR